jgi:lysophospholipase L1-like esterase
MKLLILGDSDISRWPQSLLPDWSQGEVEVQGYSGATLQEVVDKFRPPGSDTATELLTVVFCAGENDVGNGLEVEDSLAAMDKLLNVMTDVHKLIFLGPKFEPWLNEDMSSRKHYVKLSKGIRRRCENRKATTFVDCLTMFCGESAFKPGAVLVGRAKAYPKYFATDQLHLSEEGYRIWKQVVESNFVSN